MLALGAAGPWIGTRFLASEEATIHPRYRERLLSATEDDTVFLEELFDVGWRKAPIACCVTRRSKHGKRRDGLRPEHAPVRAK